MNRYVWELEFVLDTLLRVTFFKKKYCTLSAYKINWFVSAFRVTFHNDKVYKSKSAPGTKRGIGLLYFYEYVFSNAKFSKGFFNFFRQWLRTNEFCLFFISNSCCFVYQFTNFIVWQLCHNCYFVNLFVYNLSFNRCIRYFSPRRKSERWRKIEIRLKSIMMITVDNNFA